MKKYDISDELIQEMVQEQVVATTRKRIKEMQGNYTSKGFIENVIQNIVWDKISELCPNVETYINDEVEMCIKNSFKNEKISKTQLVEQIVEGLFEKFSS